MSLVYLSDACSVAIFGIIVSLMFSTGGLAFQISQGMYSC